MVPTLPPPPPALSFDVAGGENGYKGVTPSMYAGSAVASSVVPTVAPAPAAASGGRDHMADAMAALARARSIAVSGVKPTDRGGSAMAVQPELNTLESQESGATLKKHGSGQSARAALMQKLAERAGLDMGGTPAAPAPPAEKAPPSPAKAQDDDKATASLLIHNCFDKDEETDADWWLDIKADMEEECGRFGKVLGLDVKHTVPGGMVSVSFQGKDEARKAKDVFQGRWFGERQLRVEYI